MRHDDFVCDGKCRYHLTCMLRKGHHNKTLCNHLPSYENSIKRNPYKSSGSGDSIRKVQHNTVMKKEEQYNEIITLLKTKLRSFILKRFLQLFVF